MRAFPVFVILLLGTLPLLAAFPAAAQVPPPPSDPRQGTVLFDVTVNQTFVRIPFRETGTVGFTVVDRSTDGREKGLPINTPLIYHNATIRARIETPNATDWSVFLTPTNVYLTSGDVQTGTLNIVPAVKAKPALVNVVLETTWQDRDGSTVVQTESIIAQARPNYLFEFVPRPGKSIAQAGQYEDVVFEFQVTNFASSFDAIEFSLTQAPPAGYLVYLPQRLYIEPGETKTVQLLVKTPKGTPYEILRTDSIGVKAQSVLNPNAQMTAYAIVKVSGPYVSDQWIPMMSLGLLCLGLVVQRARRSAARRSAERGGPRPLMIPPRQRVALRELRRTNPEAYKAQMARLAGLYAARKQAYKGHRKEAKAEEAEARRESKAQLKVERKARAEREKAAAVLLAKRKKLEKEKEKRLAKAQKAQAKVDKKEAKARQKLEKKQAKVEAKERKRLEKVLKKKQAVLKKAQAKAAKAQAKADAAAAKQAKKDEAAARKAAKKTKGK